MEFRCVCLCKQDDLALLQNSAEEFYRLTGRRLAFTPCEKLQELLSLAKEQWDAMLVFMPGAVGMEAANGARQVNEKAPLVWISDDEGFAVHSYRLKAKAFLRQPVTNDDIAEALVRCIEN